MKRSILLTLVALALTRGLELEVRTQEPSHSLAPVTDAMLLRPDPADWLTWRRTLDGWGYSPLDRINRANVARLRMVWTRVLGPGLQEGTPLVHDGVMYVPTTGDDILAVDAKPGDRDLGPHDHQRQLRQFHLRARCPDRRAGVGDAGARSEEAGAGERRADRGRRQGHHRPSMSAGC